MEKITAAAVALDIGTTTVSAQLINLDPNSGYGKIIDTICELNEQTFYGTDIIRRIYAAKKGKTEKLYELINRQTEKILKTFMQKWNIQEIKKLSVSGNTVMLHLFLNIDPSSMGQIPFTPVFLEEKELKGDSLSLSAKDISILPSISTFIGADVISGLAALDILNTPSPSLLVDIGTNGEMALVTQNKIFCCSAAAGPAFEGVHISCGMGGVKGAIKSVELKSGEITITTINNEPPAGICGSGLIDAVSVMLKQRIIDEAGNMTEKSFSVYSGITITDKDIREFQLAKSAIFAGIKILLNNAQLQAKDIKNVYITGGFGVNLNKQNMITTGILPKEFLEKITFLENLSLQGAAKNIIESNFMEKCKEIKAKCKVIDLAQYPDFADEFMNNMFFTI